MIICLCKGIREAEFVSLAARCGACPDTLKRVMGLDDSCCGRCEANLETLLQETTQCAGTRPAVSPHGLLSVEERL
jgi:bacterioferritin-associated ferredoxin